MLLCQIGIMPICPCDVTDEGRRVSCDTHEIFRVQTY